jgi:type 1 glutamine amidotransferase
MGVVRYDAPLNALVFTKGHPFERDAFHAVLESWPDIACTAVEHPAAQAFLDPDAARPYDALVFYDMPGIEFRPDGPRFHEPPASVIRGLEALLSEGKGLVFLHHAIAGWPTWDRYAEIMGGRFLYQPATLRGRACPDSGFRHEVKHRVSVVDAEHPIVSGIEGSFEIEDEVYLHEVFEDELTPLLRSDHDFVEDHFFSAANAVRGKMFSREGWTHPPGSNLIGWARHDRQSPIVTLACGDSPNAYANPAFRTLLGNAIRWVASDEARAGSC